MAIIIGTPGDDTRTGTNQSDLIFLGRGNDVGFGLKGNDWLRGQAGNDLLSGGDARDRLVGGAGIDTLFGDSGDDTLLGEAGTDSLFGGSGNDSLRGGDDADLLAGREGQDRLVGGSGDDSLEGGTGNDSLDGGSGLDTAVFLGDRAGFDIVESGDGTVTVTDTDASDGNEGSDRLRNVERLVFGDATVELPRDVLFVAAEGTLNVDLTFGVYRFDGSGVTEIAGIATGTSGGRNVSVTGDGERAWVEVSRFPGEDSLYRIDAGGVTEIDLPDEFSGGDVDEPTIVGDLLYFTARDPDEADLGETEREVWVYDGNSFTEIDLDTGGDSFPVRLAEIDGTLWVAVAGLSGNRDLWRVDGTTATRIDINPDGSSEPGPFAVGAGGAVYVSARGGTAAGGDEELYRVVGTSFEEIDLNPDGDSDPTVGSSNLFGVVGNALYFRADVGAAEDELFRVVGTTPTRININDGGSDAAQGFTATNNALYVTAEDGTDRGLYRVVGPGFTEVTDVNVIGTEIEFAGDGAAIGDTAFVPIFYEDDSIRLWRLDGTDAEEVEFGADLIGIRNLTAIGDRLFMQADIGDGEGREMWVLDGDDLTRFVINPGAQSSNPDDFVPFG